MGANDDLRDTFQELLKVFPDLTGRCDFFDAAIPRRSLNLEGDQLTFTLEFGSGDQTSQREFKDTLDDATLKGEFVTSRGAREAVGKKVR